MVDSEYAITREHALRSAIEALMTLSSDDALYVARLIPKIKIDPTTGCWLWTGSKCGSNAAYGHTTFNKRPAMAHRLMFELFHGPIPKGVMVCHRCDRPGCINPDHLWGGSAQENMADCTEKGRRGWGVFFGEDNVHCKVKWTQVQEIRATPRGYGTGIALARKYGISRFTVQLIRDGKRRVNA